MSNRELPELDSRPQGRREWSGALSSLVLPLAFVAVIIGGLLFWQTTRGGREDGGEYGTVSLDADHNPSGKPPEAAVGRAAPNFILDGIRETLVHLQDKQGRPAIVTFFATWCVDCRTQMPVLVQAAADAGLRISIMAVNLQEAEEPVTQFAADYGATFPILLDRQGDVASTWRVGGKGEPLPATFFIDATGVIRKVVAGPVTAADMAQGVSLIAGGPD